ncbi:calmin isoform X2 [Salarias fasciatus]|uniref:calmin isoform X2 n=1 Tax=Salarias fasciatus TaxID=181472 RepID=UPI0011769901|nr:calmin-like isoform X2 [Salarias fasciatus]
MQDDWDSQRKPEGEIRDQRVQPRDERTAVQQRVFTRWMNVFLQRRDPPIQVLDLFSDVQDGRVLMALLEELSGCRLLYRFRSSSHRIFRLNNISKALAFLDDRHVKLLGIDATGVSDGVPSVVLSLIWNLILHFQVKEVMGGLHRRLSSSLTSLSVSSYPSSDDLSPRGDEPGSYSSNTLPSKGRRAAREPKYHGKALKSLLQWVQRCTKKYGIDVQDFGRSWRSGLAFLGLIKSINPDLVDLRESFCKEPRENIQQAFMIAQQSLDIPPLLEPEDVMSSSPDEKSIITYVSMFLGLHSLSNEGHTTNSEIPEIPNFGSPESVGLGETLADDPEAQTFLKGLETSSEQQLWKRWSRKSGSTRPALLGTNGETKSVSERPLVRNAGRSRRSLQPPSPLDATVISPEIQSWMEMDSGRGHGKRRSDDNHISLSSEEGIYTLPALDSDEEDAYSYILDLNKDVFQPYNQLKRQVPKVEEETAEEMIEELKRPEVCQTVNGGLESPTLQSEDLDQGSLIEAESEVHRKFNLDMNESFLREVTNNRGEFDPEPGAESGRKEERQQGRAVGEQSSSDGGCGEEVEEKKMENVRWVKDVSDEISNDAVKAKVSKVACWQKSVEEGEEGGLFERRVSEWRVAQDEDEREHLARCENVHNLGNIGEESEVREKEQRMKSQSCEVRGKTLITQTPVSTKGEGGRSRVFECQGKILSIRNPKDEEEMEETNTKNDQETAAERPAHENDTEDEEDAHHEDDAATAASQSVSEEGFAPPSPPASCDLTPLELEVLLVLWILLYCCLLLPQMNL